MHEQPDFDLDRAMSQAWDTFAERLAEVLASMDETADLTIDAAEPEPGGGEPCVSFSFRAPDTVVARASSNASLADRYQLTPEQLTVLEAAGWRPPSADGPDASPDFTASAPQERTDELARLAVVALRDGYGVRHPAFLAPDQLAEILTLRDDAPRADEFHAMPADATLAEHRTHLETLVRDELAALFGHLPLRDDDGDWGVRVGSTMVFVRVTADAEEIVVFAAVVHDVDGRSRAVEVLNDLNAETRFVRFELIRDRVFVQMSVLARPFAPEHLRQAVRLVSEVADGVDEGLAAKLGGRTTFPTEP